jgi:hypothetical protein
MPCCNTTCSQQKITHSCQQKITHACQVGFVRRANTVGVMNETAGNSHAKVGRPRRELTPARKRVLERLATRVARRHGDLNAARADLAVAAREAHTEGASVRAIAEAVGLSRPRVHELLSDKSGPRSREESRLDGRGQ